MGKDGNGGKGRPDRIGILTFHCADNFGAMLQAYGLLSWLRGEGYDAFVVNYVPAFLRGREWLVPYVPRGSFRKMAADSLWGLRRNLAAGRDWWKRRRLMASFREEYLTGGSRAIRRDGGLSRLDADVLVVGSDQIWNPDIACGLRPAYFGAFPNGRIRKTVAYGASFGASSLPTEAEPGFLGLLASVGEVSMREKDAAGYVESRFGRRAVHVADPVFLPDPAEWRALADVPEGRGFVFLYETERCGPLREAAARFAREKGLEVVAVSAEGNGWGDLPFRDAWAAGPAQFLGYVSAAGYVFTNSFHGLAFSILFHKQFLVRGHSTVGARTAGLLESAGLTERMAAGDRVPDMDREIDWADADRRLGEQREWSMAFLRRSLGP